MEPEAMARLMTRATTRRQLLRQAGIAGAGIAGASLIAACGGSGGSSSDGTVTIEFWDEVWGGEQYGPTVKALIAEYEKANPNVKIKYRTIPWANFFEVYNTAIASGSTPDVAVAPTFPWRGSLASLDGIVEKWQEDGTYDDFITEAIEDQKDADGVLTGLPWGIELRVISYRKDRFAEAGVQVPRTLEELGQAARDLSGNGRYGLGFTSETLGSQMLYSLFLNNGGGLFDYENCGPGMTNERNREICEWVQQLVRDGAVPKAAGGWVPDDLTAAMNTGDIAMAFNSPGWFGALDAKIMDDVAIMPPPEGFHGDKGTIVYNQPVWEFEASEHKEQASDFIEWWLTNLNKLFENGQVTSLPALRSSYSDVEVFKDPRFQVVLDEWVPVGKSIAGKCNAEVLYVLNAVEGGGFLQTLTQDILTLKDVDKSLQTAQDALTEILASNA